MKTNRNFEDQSERSWRNPTSLKSALYYFSTSICIGGENFRRVLLEKRVLPFLHIHRFLCIIDHLYRQINPNKKRLIIFKSLNYTMIFCYIDDLLKTCELPIKNKNKLTKIVLVSGFIYAFQLKILLLLSSNMADCY